MRRIYNYLNPLNYLGIRKYSVRFPILFSLLVVFLSEYYSYNIAHDPLAVGKYIIFINAASVIYFSFRNAIKGGLITTFIAILYYLYIIYTRNYEGNALISGIFTTVYLGILFSFIAVSIGFLKQTIDKLIDNEADEKKRLQTIIDQLPVGIIVTDMKGKITHANNQIKKLLGKEINKDLKSEIYTTPEATISGKVIKADEWPLLYTLNTGKSFYKKEILLENENGQNFFLHISSSIIKNKAEMPVAAATIYEDVTVQKEIENRKDDFINMASHELKTPITSIKLYTDSLYSNLRKTLDSKNLKSLKSIRYQTEQLQNLVYDLLDVSKIQTGKLNFEKIKFNLRDLISDAVSEIQKTTQKHKIVFKGKSRRIYVMADKFRIYQVITNILTNAVKYSPDGGNILVRLKIINGKTEVSVEDTGIGIDRDKQSKIFDKLYQVSDPKEKTFPGLGMGLYISKEIIKKHKGKIWVTSKKNKGSTFFFSLPVDKQKKLEEKN